MEWHSPQLLYLILPLAAAWFALALYSESRRRAARAAFVSAQMQPRILPTPGRLRFWLRLLASELAIVCGLTALAGPRFGTETEIIIPRGSDLYVLIDVSRSMLAEDVVPSRLGRAKADVAALVNRLQGERIGLIAFAGQAVVKCPLTVDYDSFRRTLYELDPGSAPLGGTAIGDAIRRALEVFQARSERDQTILLITDGDDQQSYPLEAAALAAERQVTIVAVGLGDVEQGARIPQSPDSAAFIEYQGEQVWSKLDSSLLQEIALATNGVYVPAGIRSFDLGELYVSHLQGRRHDQSEGQERIRRSEQFQLFLGMTLLALLLNLLISPYRSAVTDGMDPGINSAGRKSSELPVLLSALIAVTQVLGSSAAVTEAGDSRRHVREGLQLYAQEQYQEASEKFAAAGESLDQRHSTAAAIAAFDEACALHRSGNPELARERYLTAGLSRDRRIATAAHFNLGNLVAEQARTLAGDRPEAAAPEVRQDLLNHLQQAIVAYRHCLELQPDHAPARRNLELIRQWIRHYSNRWQQLDRQQRRDESTLIQFLEFLIDTQSTLRKAVSNMPVGRQADAFAEFRRLQLELREELPTLREKIDLELQPAEDMDDELTAAERQQIDAGKKLLHSWVDASDNRMAAAADALRDRSATQAGHEQQNAVDELDHIWNAVIPFHPLLQQELTDQTAVNAQLESADPDVSQLTELTELQERVLQRARLLAPKAEAELLQLQSQTEDSDRSDTPQQPQSESDDEAGSQLTEVPLSEQEQLLNGYRMAIELAPLAVEQMETAVRYLHQQEAVNAAPAAAEARRILQEILDAQPKNEQQQNDQHQQDRSQDNQQQDNQRDQQQPDDDAQNDGKDDHPNAEQQDSSSDPQQQVSADRIEEALRKVREREQEKRERDRELRSRIIGRSAVDRDW